MSFANIGKILGAGTDFTQLSKVVTSIGNLDDGAIALNSVNGLSDNLKIGVLVGGLNDVNASMARTALGISDVADAAGDATVASSSFGNALKGAGKSASTALVSFAKTPLGMAAIAAAAIAAIALIVDAVTTTQEEANEKARESADAYQTTKSELESLNSELQTTVDRMNELQNKDSLTVVEEEEYAKLQQTNKELELQISLKEKIAQMQAKQAAEDAAAALTNTSHYRAVLGEPGTGATENATHSVASVEQIDLIDKTSDDIDRLNQLTQNRLVLLEELSNMEPTETFLGSSDYERKEKQLAHMETEISNLEESITTNMTDISTLSESLYAETGSIAEGYENLADRVDHVSAKFSSLGEIVDEDIQHLDEFFSKKSGLYLKEELEDIAKESGSSEKALTEFKKMGLSLDDIGVSEEGFKRYFDDIAKSATKAEEAINAVGGSVEDVTAAFESDNQNKDWTTMADFLDQAKDLFKEGLIGTDDFQTAVQFMTPDIIDADDGYKYDADAYVEYWQKAQDKVKRYFNSENPLKSMYNFSEDLVDAKLAKKIGDEYIWAFETSAQAADALGLSLEATEVIMRSLESYGAEFGEVKFSGEMLSDYESALTGIKSIYESIEDEELKQELELKIKGWDEEYSHLSENLDELTEEQIIQIKFEYDLATILKQIEEFQNAYNESGSAEDQAAINVAKRRYRETREEQVGYDDASRNDSAYSSSYNQITLLQEQLKNTTSEEIQKGLRDQISLIYDMQNAFLDFRAEGGTLDWAEYLNSDDMRNTLMEIISETGMTSEELSELLGVEIDASLDDRELQKQIAALDVGGTITYTADVDGVERDIKVVRNADGAVSYTANVDGIETELTAYRNADGTISYYIAEQEEPEDGKTAGFNYELINQENPTPQNTLVNYKKGTQEKPEDKIAKVNYVQGSVPSAGSALAAKGKSSGTSLSPARASGTAYNVLNTIPAYSNGKVALSKDETALVNELGTESIIRNGKWFLIPGGMHTENLKKGDIVLSASQTKQLLNYGRASGYGHSYAYGTLANAYNNESNGWNPFGSLTRPQVQGGSSDKASNDNKDTDEFKEDLNWIEIAISRIQRLITNFGKTVDATYKSWSTRNKAITDEVSKINEEISLQQQAYQKYMKLAEGVGLDDYYEKLVQTGAIAYETITDETLNEQITKYRDFFEAALEAQDAVIDLKDSIVDLAVQKFDNVVSEYDGQLAIIEHRINMIEGLIDQTEERGHLVSASYYNELINQEKQNISMLKKEYVALNNALKEVENAGAGKHSEEWDNLYADIMDVEEAILDANTALIEYNNSLRELEWDVFDRMLESMSGVIDENDFFKELLSYGKLINDNGLYTSLGQATQGLNAVNMNAYFAQAEEYKKEIAKLNDLLVEDPDNTKIQERRNELMESYRDAILSAKDAQKEMMEMEEERYDALLSYMQDAIDKQNEQNQQIADQRDFQKTVEEQAKTLADLQKIAKAVQGDDSESNRLFAQQTDQKLKEAESDLQETLYDQYLSDQEKLYDTLYNQTEEWINNRLDNQDLLTQTLIDSTNANAESIKATLESEANAVGITLSDKMESIWSTGGTFTSVVSTYQENFSNLLTTTNSILNGIKDTIADMVKDSDEEAKKEQAKLSAPATSTPSVSASTSSTTTNKTSTSTSSSGSSGGSSGGSGKWGSWFIPLKSSYNKSKLNTSQSIVDRLKYFDFSSNFADRASYYKSMGGTGTYTGSASQNTWMISEMRKNSFAKGGTIGNLVKATGEDGFVLARAGESIINEDQMRELRSTLLAAQPLVDGLRYVNPNMMKNAQNVNNHVEMSITLPNVTNYDQFKRDLQRDKQFENLVLDITHGSMLGKNSLTKYRQIL